MALKSNYLISVTDNVETIAQLQIYIGVPMCI